jgi:hypothetical protein
MRCADCVVEKRQKVNEATQVLILESPEDKILPLCYEHLHEYIQLEGELNLDFYMVRISGIGEEAFMNRLNEILGYKEKQYVYLLDEYNKIKKEVRYVSSEEYIENLQKKYPNKIIPPYPYGVSGDMIPELRECQKCGKLFWNLEYGRKLCGKC